MRSLLAAVGVFMCATTADARTWTVGGQAADFPFITPAIAAAAPGDVIEVRPGVYREDVVLDKPLYLRGIGYPIVFGTGIGTVVTIAAPGSEVSGFAIEGSGTGQANTMDAAVQVLSSGNRIVGNRMRRVFYGVVVSNATRNEIADNDIDGLRELPYGQRGDGIYAFRAPETFVARNRIAGERDGIYFQYAPHGRAVDNVVSDARYGLHDMFSDDAVVARNTFSDSAVGANIMNSRRIRVERNTLTRDRGVPGVALALKDCDASSIRGNIIAGNARGLLVDGSSTNQFIDNTFETNDTAVTLFASAERNVFSRNRFVGNWSDVVVSGGGSATAWSLDGVGNTWDRYRGFDFDGDGVGDAPHPLVGAFERIEGANAAARLFLQSPAASGLDLAARLSGGAPAVVDEKPLVGSTGSAPRRRTGWFIAIAIGLFAVGRPVRRSREDSAC